MSIRTFLYFHTALVHVYHIHVYAALTGVYATFVHKCVQTYVLTRVYTHVYAHAYPHFYTHVHAQVCPCGNRLMPDAEFCRKCGQRTDLGSLQECAHMCIHGSMPIDVFIYVY